MFAWILVCIVIESSLWNRMFNSPPCDHDPERTQGIEFAIVAHAILT